MSVSLKFSLETLMQALPQGRFFFQGNRDQEITAITWDYQKVSEGSLYFCLEEEEFQEAHIQGSSLQHWPQAVEAGACCLVARQGAISDLPEGVSLIEVSNVNQSLSLISRVFHEDPLSKMKVVGITGTNGKTTTSQLVDAVLLHANRKSGVVGTIGIFYPSQKEEASHLSNPLANDLFEIGYQMKQEQVDSLVMEVTSHGMAFDRTFAIDYDVAVFTNLTQDHLDYHKTFDAYKEAKLKHFRRLGSMEKKGYGVVNIDDAHGLDFVNAVEPSLIRSGKAQILTYGIKNKDADLVAYPRQMTGSFSEFDVFLRGDFLCKVNLPMPGLFNIYNAMAAFGAAFAIGIGMDQIAEGLAKAHQVDGRFEQVACDSDYDVYIDYAHTPDSLEKILEEIRKVTKKKVIVVFGCGGDRDRSKRPEMGAIGAKLADICVVTSDNPRREDPDRICNDILAGMKEMDPSNLYVEVDRREAIYQALTMADQGDSVLIAGKGHETYQIIGTVKQDFSDRKVVKDFFLKPKDEFSRAWLKIDREVLRENLRLIQQDKPKDLKVLSVVKDNALGHGILEVSKEVVQAGCDYLGVAFVSEALRIRQSGLDQIPILVFGERAEEELATCIRHNLTLQVQTVEKVRLIGQLSRKMKKTTKVHFKVDTGMGRYGVRFDQAVEVFEAMTQVPSIEIEGIMTHFAQSDELKKDYANLQWERFQQVLEKLKEKEILPPIVHACNTGGYLDLPHAHCDMVRTGILPFGVYPSKVCRRINVGGQELQPVMSVGAKVSFIKELEEGDSVGYGMHFQAKGKMKVAILPIGYGDGYPRLRNKGHVLIRGQEAAIVGGNGMDGTMVDVSQIPDITVGDEVVLLGKQGQNEITARMLADWAGTVTYDVMSRWTERIERWLV